MFLLALTTILAALLLVKADDPGPYNLGVERYVLSALSPSYTTEPQHQLLDRFSWPHHLNSSRPHSFTRLSLRTRSHDQPYIILPTHIRLPKLHLWEMYNSQYQHRQIELLGPFTLPKEFNGLHIGTFQLCEYVLPDEEER